MADSHEQVIRLLREARSVELHRIAELRAAAGNASGAYRERLEAHVAEERSHADRVQVRLDQLGGSPGLLEAGLGVLSGFVAVGLRLARRPLDLVENVATGGTTLRGPREQAGAEAFELAGYVALERIAADSGDTKTAELARDVQEDERRMLEAVEDAMRALAKDLAVRPAGPEAAAAEPAERDEPPAAAAVPGDVEPPPAEDEERFVEEEAEPPPTTAAEPSPEADLAGAAEAPPPATMREAGRSAAEEDVELVAEFAEPGAEEGAGAEVHVEPPWEGYDRMTAAEIERRLRDAGPVVAAAVHLYEQQRKGRDSILRAAESVVREHSAPYGRA